MEKLALLLLVLPVVFLSCVITLAFCLYRLSKSEISTPVKTSILGLLYIIYIYVTLSFSYNLMGSYSYSFVLETVLSFYFFPQYGHLLYLATPILTICYYVLTGSYSGDMEFQFIFLGSCLFIFTSLLKALSKLDILYNVIVTFVFKYIVLVLFYLCFKDYLLTKLIDDTLVLFGSLTMTFILWQLYRLKLNDEAQIQQAIEQGQIDALTNTYNFHKLRNDLNEFQQNKQFYSLAMIDLDHFKKLNDTFGHTEGNEVLKDFARCLDDVFSQRFTRDRYRIYRFGGEEFCVLLLDFQKKAAFKELSFFKTAYVKRQRLLQKAYEVTFSVGIESNQVHQYDGMKTMHCADEALYDAKRSGRNQIKLYANKH
ncbi:GGDEF domain-containing protein [Enterococcus saccharolyticus]|uniref:GGDEF domain-containing protein n=1 Tax=Enterococcus TaxID=1350 RepID=UPI001E326D23|nr:GGDEF domain-containing protein [Enterococcus saccharolyticus]MCD5002961.1 GGDEF domain-containing protein [Enterococcus saccharolyticus]